MVAERPAPHGSVRTRRVVWSAVGGRLTHHNASAQVFDEGSAGCRLVWIADLLPDELAPMIAGMIDQGAAAMKRTMEGAATAQAGGST